jgi:hypothetical protein
LSEKALASVPGHRERSERKRATWGVLLPEAKWRVEAIFTALAAGAGGGTRFREIEKRGRTALTALGRIEIINRLEKMMAVPLQNGASYDGTAALNT